MKANQILYTRMGEKLLFKVEHEDQLFCHREVITRYYEGDEEVDEGSEWSDNLYPYDKLAVSNLEPKYPCSKETDASMTYWEKRMSSLQARIKDSENTLKERQDKLREAHQNTVAQTASLSRLKKLMPDTSLLDSLENNKSLWAFFQYETSNSYEVYYGEIKDSVLKGNCKVTVSWNYNGDVKGVEFAATLNDSYRSVGLLTVASFKQELDEKLTEKLAKSDRNMRRIRGWTWLANCEDFETSAKVRALFAGDREVEFAKVQEQTAREVKNYTERLRHFGYTVIKEEKDNG